NKRLLDRTRSGDASRVLTMPVRHVGFDALRGRTHMLLVTYRRDGTPVPTPVWFGQDGDRLYVWTEEHAYKAKRLRRQGRALVAPSTARGAPTGEPIAALGRVIDDAAGRERAAQVIQRSWGPLRRLFERMSRPVTDAVFIELTPDRPMPVGSEP
ncbi:MAG: PPOX class F420-dependent oxidoreductase, partial [Solirubrobacteraceae bacterium]|nr:PPOX class F420-dependent oxidoreductase [Solirubrobacteraceae bacterium]